MRNLLPTSTSFSVNKQKGFTLVELLVVIVILAILGIVGITIFTGTQAKARDAKRKSDIQAISKAMEANYVAGTGYTTVISSTWFADQQVPSNPGPSGTTYQSPTVNLSTYVLCAQLEGGTGNATTSTATSLGQTSTGGWFCKRNSQ